MKKDAIYLAIIVLLLGFVVVLMCTGPAPPDPAAEQYKDSVKVLKSEKAEISSRFEDLRVYASNKAISDSVQLMAQEREITRLKVKASQARTPKVDKLIIENPELKVFVESQDSVIHQQGILIDTLKSQVAFERNVREQLVALHYDSEKIQSNLFEVCEIERIRLQDMNERLRKKSRGKGLWFGGGFVAGWLARSGVSQL